MKSLFNKMVMFIVIVFLVVMATATPAVRRALFGCQAIARQHTSMSQGYNLLSATNDGANLAFACVKTIGK